MDFLLAEDETTKSVSHLYDAIIDSLPDGMKASYEDMLNWYHSQPLDEKALPVGIEIENFVLKTSDENLIELYDLLANNTVIMTFYRGEWCQFCDYYFSSMQQSFKIFLEGGATLLSVSPQNPKTMLEWNQKQEQGFTLIYDNQHEIAKRFGLLYQVPDFAKDFLLALGADLNKYQGNWYLPLTATYIITQDRKIAWRDVAKDFRYRASPQAIHDGLG